MNIAWFLRNYQRHDGEQYAQLHTHCPSCERDTATRHPRYRHGHLDAWAIDCHHCGHRGWEPCPTTT